MAGADRAADAHVAAQADAHHVQDGRRTGQDVARDVHVAPRDSQRPITLMDWPTPLCISLSRVT